MCTLKSLSAPVCGVASQQDLKARSDGLFGLNKAEIRMNAAIPALTFGLSAIIM